MIEEFFHNILFDLVDPYVTLEGFPGNVQGNVFGVHDAFDDRKYSGSSSLLPFWINTFLQ